MTSIQPIMFGPDESLFGVYHPARGFHKQHALLIAGPLLNEGMRAHSALRRIAIRAAKAGYDALRFDYGGMGNSLGTAREFTVADWRVHFEVATREICRRGQTNRLSVLAVRYSAAFAFDFAASRDVDNLLLWDPITSGSQWSSCLRRTHKQHVDQFPDAKADLENVFLGHSVHTNLLCELSKRDPSCDVSARQKAILSRDFEFQASLPESITVLKSTDDDSNWESRSSSVLHAHDVVDAFVGVLK